MSVTDAMPPGVPAESFRAAGPAGVAFAIEMFLVPDPSAPGWLMLALPQAGSVIHVQEWVMRAANDAGGPPPGWGGPDNGLLTA